MRAEAEAVIVLPPPVAKVVSRLFAGPREVADFVLGEPGVSKRLDHLDIERADQLFVRQAHYAAFDAAPQRGVLVEVEHVNRNVTDAAGDRFIERCPE